MVRIDIVYEGDLRTRATHAPSANTLLTDAPADNQGKGESFSPTDLVATALGSCMATIAGIAAARHDVDLRGMRITVIRRWWPIPSDIGRLNTVIHVPIDPGDAMRTRLERAALHCPVHKSLHPDVDKPVLFRWGKA